jgi:hypothetical protein
MRKYLERVVGFEVTPPDNTIFKAVEGNEPSFFTTYFSWHPSKVVVNHLLMFQKHCYGR